MSQDTVKNYGKSIRSKLLNIAKAEDIFYQTVLTRYFRSVCFIVFLKQAITVTSTLKVEP